MKQTWTRIELDYLNDLEMRETYLDLMRRVAFLRMPFWKLNYFWRCIKKLLQWRCWDFELNRKWFRLEPTEEFCRAKEQKFESFRWICSSERWIWEYTFRIEWILGMWTTKKADIELTSVDPDMSDCEREKLRDELAYHMELVSEKEVARVDKIIDWAPVTILKDVEFRRAQRIKKSVEELENATLTLIEKEENTKEG